jgi:hypothetical protein
MPGKGRYRLLERHARMKVTVKATRAACKTSYGSMLRCVSITLIPTRISLLMRTRSTWANCAIHNPVAQAIDQEPPAILCWTRHSCLRRRLQTSISSSNRDSVISTTALYRQATTNHRLPTSPLPCYPSWRGQQRYGASAALGDSGGCSTIRR